MQKSPAAVPQMSQATSSGMKMSPYAAPASYAKGASSVPNMPPQGQPVPMAARAAPIVSAIRSRGVAA